MTRYTHVATVRAGGVQYMVSATARMSHRRLIAVARKAYGIPSSVRVVVTSVRPLEGGVLSGWEHRNPRHYADTLKGNPRRRGGRGRFRHRRVRAPGRFVTRSLRTVKAGKARVIVGHLQGERKRTRRGRRKLTVQAVLTPKRARRNPVGISESEAWRKVMGHAERILERKATPTIHHEAEVISAYADVMLGQLAKGIHENPALAIVGANPPMGRVVEIRYHRDRGSHPGYYKHHFRHRPVMVALTDGSLKIGPT